MNWYENTPPPGRPPPPHFRIVIIRLRKSHIYGNVCKISEYIQLWKLFLFVVRTYYYYQRFLMERIIFFKHLARYFPDNVERIESLLKF